MILFVILSSLLYTIAVTKELEKDEEPGARKARVKRQSHPQSWEQQKNTFQWPGSQPPSWNAGGNQHPPWGNNQPWAAGGNNQQQPWSGGGIQQQPWTTGSGPNQPYGTNQQTWYGVTQPPWAQNNRWNPGFGWSPTGPQSGNTWGYGYNGWQPWSGGNGWGNCPCSPPYWYPGPPNNGPPNFGGPTGPNPNAGPQQQKPNPNQPSGPPGPGPNQGPHNPQQPQPAGAQGPRQ
ncbi:unnamed protein product [Gongylonema pulchrum]|uniref:Secreted protein n=1 Tax=Gongylonema pulchrum TaxID=637853 RepID=A0A183E6N2_9BILA|nr:unnamed protein product [Gongylonema pulchrum]